MSSLPRWSALAVIAILCARLYLAWFESGFVPGSVVGFFAKVRPNFIVGAAMLALAIWIAKSSRERRHRVWEVGLAAVTASYLALATLAGSGTGLPAGLQTILSMSGVAWESMTMTAALCLLLLSLSIFLILFARWVVLSQLLAIAPFAIAYFNLVGNLYGVDHLYGAALHSSMSVAASVICVFLSIGSLALRPRHGIVGLLTSSLLGGYVARRLVPTALILPAFLGWVRLLGEIWELYDTRFGLTLFASANIGILSLIILSIASVMNRLDLRRQGTQQTLDQSKLTYRTVVDSLPQMIWTCLPTGECDFLSQRWLEYTGRAVENQLGFGWLNAIHPADQPGLREKWESAVATGQPFDVEYRICSAAGAYRWFRGLAVPVRDPAGRIIKWFGSSTDIEDRKIAEQEILLLNGTLEQRVEARTAELIRARSHAQAVLDAATQVSIVATDASGTIQIFNAGAVAMLGYSLEETIGVATPALFHDAVEVQNRSEELARTLGHAVSGFEAFIHYPRQGQPETREWTYIRKDGHRLNVRLSVTAIFAANGAIDGYLGIAVDISERIELELQLMDQNESLLDATVEAESANAAKSEFLANMSHEIRTPMNGIIGMTGLLLDTKLDSDQQLYCENVRSSSESLLAIINDILDFSKIEAGKLDLEEIDFNLRSMLDATVQLLAPAAEAKGLELTCCLAPGLPAAVRGDPGRVRQILLNLAGNAIKFTRTGEVSIRVGLKESDSGRIHFAVADTGMGIPAARRNSLFQPFTQVDASITRKFGGTGLGLAICRELTSLMGGEIGVESIEGQGSEFWFTALLPPAVSGSQPLQAAPVDLTNIRVLIVDDSATNRLLLTNLLSGWGCQPRQAADAPAALALLRQAKREGQAYDVVLIDFRMPEQDGDELGREIKADPDCGAAVLILMSSIAQRGQARRSHEAGFAAFLTKPIREFDLRESMELALGWQPLGAGASAARPLITQHSLSESRQRRGRILLAEDNRTNQLVATAILKKLGYWVEVAANGVEAVEALRHAPYDLVLMDCQMPELDGFSATALIRAGHNGLLNPEIPVIAMTAYAMTGDREKCLAAGMNDYVSKPVDLANLTAALERWAPAARQVTES